MAATVHGAPRFGIVDESSSTGLLLAEYTTTYTVQTAYAKNHIGCDVGVSFFNDAADVTCNGVIAVKATGLVPDLAAVLTSANSAADSLATNSKNLFSTPNANAGLLVTGASMKRVNSDFETGDVSATYRPLVATNAPSTLT